MKSAFGLAILAATLVAGIGHNNWDQPCFNGECAYDLPDHKAQSGTIKLFAKSPYAIADITPAAGWVVLDCDSNALEQEIRLVCKSDDAEGAGCNHFFDGGHGPVDKYVRLPESCSSSPFGRVVNFRVHEDQSVPSHHQVTRRDGSAPQVFAVNIDNEFTAVDYSKYGDVHFVAYGTDTPGLDTNFAIPDVIDNHDAADAFLEQALQGLIDSASASRPKRSTSRPSSPSSPRKSSSSSPAFIFTHFDAYTTPYYPSGKASSKSYKFDEPEGAKKDTAVKFGSESATWAKFELKSEDLMCKKELSDKSTAQVGATITGKLDTYFWGTLGWGGAALGKNGIIATVKGFWNDLSAKMRHEISLSISLVGKVGWENELGPWAIPGITGLEFGIANLGLMGGIKLEASVTAEAVLELAGKVQYGIDRGLATVPPKPGKPDNPGFNVEGSGFNASFSSTGKAHVAFEAALTPKLLIGASAGSKTSSSKVITSAFLGFEFKFTAEAEASQEFASVGGAPSAPSSPKGSRPSSPKKSPREIDSADVDLGYAVKLGFDSHVGAEAKFWGIGPSGKWSFYTYEYEVTCGGSMCKDAKRRRSTSSPPQQTLTGKSSSPLKCPTLIKQAKNFLTNTAKPDKWKALRKATFAP